MKLLLVTRPTASFEVHTPLLYQNCIKREFQPPSTEDLLGRLQGGCRILKTGPPKVSLIPFLSKNALFFLACSTPQHSPTRHWCCSGILANFLLCFVVNSLLPCSPAWPRTRAGTRVTHKHSRTAFFLKDATEKPICKRA